MRAKVVREHEIIHYRHTVMFDDGTRVEAERWSRTDGAGDGRRVRCVTIYRPGDDLGEEYNEAVHARYAKAIERHEKSKAPPEPAGTDEAVEAIRAAIDNHVQSAPRPLAARITGVTVGVVVGFVAGLTAGITGR